MPLFLIQDDDRPMYVVDKGWKAALESWRKFIAMENEIHINEVEDPLGIQLVCKNDDLLIGSVNPGAQFINVH